MKDELQQVLKVQRAISKVAGFAVTALAEAISYNLTDKPGSGVGTPVKTGLARTNWVLTVGAPFGGLVSYVGQSNPPPVDTFARARNEQAAASYDFSIGLGVGGSGQPVFLVNNVEYIVDLNKGSSRQATAGFVQRAIEKAVFRQLAPRVRDKARGGR